MARTTAAGIQRGNEGQRVGCPSEAVVNWWTLVLWVGCQRFSADSDVSVSRARRHQDLTRPFDYNAFQCAPLCTLEL